MLVHSGSRGLGESILRAHVDQHSATESKRIRSLRRSISAATTSLFAGPRQIANSSPHRSLQHSVQNANASGRLPQPSISPSPGLAATLSHRMEGAGVTGWVHRKGAVTTDAQFVVIPGSRVR